MFLSKLNIKSRLKRTIAVIGLLAMLFSLSVASVVMADTNTANSLTIKYSVNGGSSYTTMAAYSADDMGSMTQTDQPYSHIDNYPAPCLDSVEGVTLSDLIATAGITVNDLSSSSTMTFKTVDNKSYTFTKGQLLDTNRYYYPVLYSHWVNGQATAGATDNAVSVPTMIATQDYWERNGEDENYDSMTIDGRYRLCFGQTDVSTHDANSQTKYVTEIDVIQ